jgi:hypothetical protein
MSFIGFKEGFPKDHFQLARNVLNQLPVKFPGNLVAPCNEVWNIGNRTFGLTLVQLHVLSTIQQLHRYAIVFRNVLASNQRAVVEEATYNPLICYRNSLWTKKQPATFGSVVEGRLGYIMPSKDSDRASNLLNIKWWQQSLPCLGTPGLYDRRLKVRQWRLNSIPRLAPRIL